MEIMNGNLSNKKGYSTDKKITYLLFKEKENKHKQTYIWFFIPHPLMRNRGQGDCREEAKPQSHYIHKGPISPTRHKA